VAILHPNLVVARERYDRLAGAMGIEPRDPYMDRRVIEFCLTLPSARLQSKGWPKMILRRAMRGLLPNDVIWRRGKEHLGWAFTQALFEGIPDWEQHIVAGHATIDRYVGSAFLDKGPIRRREALDTETKMRVFYLLKWIDRIHVR